MATPVLAKRKREEATEEEEREGCCWRSYASFLKEQGVQEKEKAPQVEETPPLSDVKLAEYERGRRNFWARIAARHRANPGSVQTMPGLASSSSASR